LNLPLISLLALFIAILISIFTRLNVGLLSIAFAFIIGVLIGKMRVQEVVAGFPASMFLTLVGVTLLFSQANVNGTLDKISHQALKLARGNAGVIPIIFFFLALGLASLGPGSIAATALLAPIAMAVAGRSRISGFLMAVMLCNGANAGAFSPFGPTGIIANDLMSKVGLVGVQWRNFLNTLIAQSFVAFVGYLALGGLKLFRRKADAKKDSGDEDLENASNDESPQKIEPFDHKQKLTLAVIAALVLSVVLLKIDVTIAAFIGAAFISLGNASDEKRAIKDIPWNVILMVCGVTLLVGILEKSGGMDLFTSLLAKISTKDTITGTIAFVTGAISVYSSSSGVVLPAFLPTIPGLIEKLGGGDPLTIAYSINVGAHLVDVSPLSTLGALCISNAAESENKNSLFNRMLAWGLSMCVFGALVCLVFFGLLQ
jgi:Na+/H+ antiporter NhaD/arsenite permease-like protein